MDVSVNYLAVLLAGLSSMVVGSVWYSRKVLGDIWIKLAKIDMKRTPKPNEMLYLLGATFLASLVTAYVLAHVSFLSHSYFNNGFLYDSVMTAFWVWLGFTAARILTHDLFENRPHKLTLITISHEFATLMVMGLVIGVFGI